MCGGYDGGVGGVGWWLVAMGGGECCGSWVIVGL